MPVGIGYDVHRLVEDRPLMIGGVKIPFDKGLLGHSDADVLIHAICDALLGAAALGDIGQHFPDNDPTYAGIASLKLLCEVERKLEAAGFAVVNVDSVIIAQKPKMTPYIPAMQQNVAGALRVSPQFVGIKATTTEGLGFTGQSLGIAAQAVAELRRKG